MIHRGRVRLLLGLAADINRSEFGRAGRTPGPWVFAALAGTTLGQLLSLGIGRKPTLHQDTSRGKSEHQSVSSDSCDPHRGRAARRSDDGVNRDRYRYG
jgi:hypothetical protein